MRSGSDWHALLKPLLHLVAGERGLEVVGLFVLRATEARQHDALPVEGHLEIVLQLESANDIDGLAVETRADQVLAVDREVVADQDAAARAHGEAGDVVVLREIAADAERFERWRDRGACHRLGRDLPGRRQIPIHQRRGHVEHVRVVVEPERLLVGRQQRGHIHLECKQIPNRVAVFSPVEAVHGRSAECRSCQRGTVESRFQVSDETVERRLFGSRDADGRHHPRAELADDLFPDLGAGRYVRERDGLERESRSFEPLVMTSDAGPLEQSRMIRSGTSGGLNRGSRRIAR